MKLSEVKPFLMAGFKIDCGEWFLKDNVLFYELFILPGYTKCDRSLEEFIESNKYDNKYTWRVVGIKDIEKLTREQAIKLMDAGYKITRANADGDFFFFKYKNEIIALDNDSKKFLQFPDHCFFCVNEFRLYDEKQVRIIPIFDNEPVKQELTAGKIIAMGCEASNAISKWYDYPASSLFHSSFRNNPLNFYIVDDPLYLKQEKPMNKSFAKIKPFVLAGFEFTSEKSNGMYKYRMNDNLVYTIQVWDGYIWPHAFKINEIDDQIYFLVKNQESHAKNLNYEQAEILWKAGFRIQASVIRMTGETTYQLLDNLPTTETNEMTTFDFEKALEYFNNGNKLVHEELSKYNGYLIKDSVGNIVDKDGDIYTLSNDEIFKAKWSLYEEKLFNLNNLIIRPYANSENEFVIENKIGRHWGFIRNNNKEVLISKSAIEKDGFTLDIF